MKKIAKLLCVILSLCITLTLSAAAATADFSWKEYDKCYVTFVLDDLGEDTRGFYSVFNEYNMPFSCAVPAYKLDGVSTAEESRTELLLDIQNHGGEVLSHAYSHNAFSKTTTEDVIEEEFSKSYQVLTNAGLNINGIIEVGSGGDETKVNYDIVEKVVRKYYKYSDRYGTSLQYRSVRQSVSGQKIGKLKYLIDKAAENNEWLILFAHSFKEISKEDLTELLTFISENENVEMVTYKYMYETFGNYTGSAPDFGKTYYTVDFVGSDKNSISSIVVAAGETPEFPTAPTGTHWDTEPTAVTNNMTVTAVAENVGTTGTADGETNDNTPPKATDTSSLTVIIIIAAAVILIAAVIIILIVVKKKRKKD